MLYRRFAYLVVFLLMFTALALPAATQEELDPIVDGLMNPRNLTYDSEGNLYIAEAGNAGDLLSDSDTEFGATSQITMIGADGSRDVVVRGLISYRSPDSLGAHAVHVTDESIWVLIGESSDMAIPWTHALVELDKENGRVKTFIDLLALELEEDPDGNPNQQSNPTDFAVADDGSIYIANAGCNCLMVWTEADGLSIAAAWPFEGDNPVPTSVEIGPDGDIYVGFLTGFPFPKGGSRIERWSGGELAETYEGLTAVSGLLVTDDGTLYATEFGSFNQGWEPGRVVMVSSDGITPVMEGLPNAFGLAQAPDGTIVVSINAATGDDSGAVVALPGM